jgi:hypothetical protein
MRRSNSPRENGRPRPVRSLVLGYEVSVKRIVETQAQATRPCPSKEKHSAIFRHRIALVSDNRDKEGAFAEALHLGGGTAQARAAGRAVRVRARPTSQAVQAR